MIRKNILRILNEALDNYKVKYQIVINYEGSNSDPIYREIYDNLNIAKKEFDDIREFDEDKPHMFKTHYKILYKLFIDGDGDIYDSEQIDLIKYHINEDSDKLIDLLKKDLEQKYNIKFNYSYNRYADYYFDEDYEPITIRISDHSENVLNHQRFGSEYSLSIVVADKNNTRNKFGTQNQFYRTNKNIELHFNSTDDYDDILYQIDNNINNIIDLII